MTIVHLAGGPHNELLLVGLVAAGSPYPDREQVLDPLNLAFAGAGALLAAAWLGEPAISGSGRFDEVSAPARSTSKPRSPGRTAA